MKPSKIRILLVDDHFFVRIGLADSLNQEPDMVVVAETGKGSEAISAYREHQPDVAIIDRRLPDFSGTRSVEEICAEFPKAHIIMLSVDETEEDIHAAVSAGVKSYLPKSAERFELLSAIRAVAEGKSYFPPTIAERLERRRRRNTLTAREIEVLRQVAIGKANKEIADLLDVAEVTVKVHVSNILSKLGAPDRTRAVTVAIERGIVRM